MIPYKKAWRRLPFMEQSPMINYDPEDLSYTVVGKKQIPRSWELSGMGTTTVVQLRICPGRTVLGNLKEMLCSG